MNTQRLRRTLSVYVLLLGISLALTGWLLGHVGQPAQAQDLGLEISKSLQGSTQVQVGQILEFTIDIRNTGSLTLTRLVVVDEFVPSIVAPSGEGEFAEAGDPPLAEPPATFNGTNEIRWENALSEQPGGVLPPGESMTLRVRLRAVRPTADLQVVNRARVEEAIRSDGSDLGQREAESVGAEIGGASAPVEKRVAASQPVETGQEVPFEIEIRNAGLVDLEEVPISDFYDPSVLQFLRAVPQPSSVNETQGVLEWSDLLAAAGVDRLRPGETIRISTVYLALRPIDASINQVRTRGVRDRYENEVEGEQAEVPIQIIPAQATATPTSVLTVTATAITTDTATSTATATPTSAVTVTSTIGTTSTATSIATSIATPTATRTAVAVATRAPRRDDDDDPTNTPQATATLAATTTPEATATTAVAATRTSVAATTGVVTATATATATTIRPIALPDTSGTLVRGTGNVAVVLWGMLAVLLVLAGIATRHQFAAMHRTGQPASQSATPYGHVLLLALLAALIVLTVLLLYASTTFAATVAATIEPGTADALHPHTALLTATLGLSNTAFTFAGASGGRMSRLAADEQVIYAGQGSALSTYQYGTRITGTDTITPLARLVLPGLVEAVQLDPARAHAYIATGSGGVQVVDVQNPAQPELLGSVQLPGTARDLSLTDEQLYVVATGRNGGIHVVNRQNPAQPFLQATLPITGAVQEISVAGGYAYVAAGFTGGLVVLDVASTVTPTVVGRSDTDGLAQALAVTGTTLIMADGDEGVLLYDVSNPTEPRRIRRISTVGPATDVTIRGDLVHVAVDTAGVQTFLLAGDRLEPLIRIRLDGAARQVVATAARLLAATGTTIELLDRTAPTSSRSTGAINSVAQARSLAASRDTLFVAAGEQGVLAYGLHEPLTPTLLSQTPITGTALKLVLRDDLLYVAAATGGVYVLDVARPQRPLLRSSIALTGSVVGLDVVGTTAYAALGNRGVQLIDLRTVIDPPVPPLLPVSGTLPLSTALPLNSTAQVTIALPLPFTVPLTLPQPLTGTLDITGSLHLSTTVAISGAVQFPTLLPDLVDGGDVHIWLNGGLPISTTLPMSANVPLSGVLPISISLDLATLNITETSQSQLVTITAPLSLTSTLPVHAVFDVMGNLPSNGVRPAPDGAVITGTVQVSGAVQGDWDTPIAGGLSVNATLNLSDTLTPLPPLATPISITLPASTTFAITDAVSVQASIPLSTALPPVPASVRGSYKTPGSAFDVQSSGSRAYIADGQSLQVLTVTNDLSPTLASSLVLSAGTSLQGLQLVADRLYAVDGGLDSALAIFDVSSSFTPTLLGRLSLVPRASPYGVRVLDQQAIVAAGIAGVQVIDSSQPQQPVRIGTYDTPGVAHDLALVGNYLYIADYDGGLQILRRTTLDQRAYLPLVARQ